MRSTSWRSCRPSRRSNRLGGARPRRDRRRFRRPDQPRPAPVRGEGDGRDVRARRRRRDGAGQRGDRGLRHFRRRGFRRQHAGRPALRSPRRRDATVEMRLLASDIDGGAFGAAAGMTRLAPIGRGTVSVILKGAGSAGDRCSGNANGRSRQASAQARCPASIWTACSLAPPRAACSRSTKCRQGRCRSTRWSSRPTSPAASRPSRKPRRIGPHRLLLSGIVSMPGAGWRSRAGQAGRGAAASGRRRQRFSSAARGAHPSCQPVPGGSGWMLANVRVALRPACRGTGSSADMPATLRIKLTRAGRPARRAGAAPRGAC